MILQPPPGSGELCHTELRLVRIFLLLVILEGNLLLSGPVLLRYPKSAPSLPLGRERSYTRPLPDPYAANATCAFPPTLILHGDADTFVTVSDAHKLEAQLTALNVPHETHIFPNQGHWFDSTTQLQILLATARFLSQHL